MIHFTTRNSLLEYLDNHVSQRSIRRALDQGMVEVLGGFNQISPSTDPGWIVEITSVFGKIWYVAIKPRRLGQIIREIDSVPWAAWCGKVDRGCFSVYDGDFPEKYAELRKKAIDEMGKH